MKNSIESTTNKYKIPLTDLKKLMKESFDLKKELQGLKLIYDSGSSNDSDISVVIDIWYLY